MGRLSHKKILLKTITYRVGATLILFSITWGVTGDPLIGLGVGVIDIVAKMVWYYLHEHVWNKIKL